MYSSISANNGQLVEAIDAMVTVDTEELREAIMVGTSIGALTTSMQSVGLTETLLDPRAPSVSVSVTNAKGVSAENLHFNVEFIGVGLLDPYFALLRCVDDDRLKLCDVLELQESETCTIELYALVIEPTMHDKQHHSMRIKQCIAGAVNEDMTLYMERSMAALSLLLTR